MSDDVPILQAILARLDRLQAGQDRLQSEMGEVRSEMGGLRSEMGGLRSELRQVHTEQDQLRHELAALDARVTQNHADVLARIDKIQADLTLHVEGRVVDFATGERAEKIARDTQAHLTALVSSISDQVNGMWRVIHQLQTEVRDLRRGAS